MPGVIRDRRSPGHYILLYPRELGQAIQREIPKSPDLSPYIQSSPASFTRDPFLYPLVLQPNKRQPHPKMEELLTAPKFIITYPFFTPSTPLALCSLCLTGGRVGRKTGAAFGPFCCRVTNYFTSTQFPVQVYLLHFPLFSLIGISQIAPCSSLHIFCCEIVTRSLPGVVGGDVR